MIAERGVEFYVTAPPHLRTVTTLQIRFGETLAVMLLPLTAAVHAYGARAMLTVLAALLGAYAAARLAPRSGTGDPFTLHLHALVIGATLSLALPAGFPAILAALGAFFAVMVGRDLFGGLGANPFNAAMVGQAFLMLSFPREMLEILAPSTPFSREWLGLAVPSAPVAQTAFQRLFAENPFGGDHPLTLQSLLLGHGSGWLGDASAIAMIAAGSILLLRSRIEREIPAGVLLGGLLAGIALATGQGDPRVVVGHLLTGGFPLLLFFVATDPVTSPITPRGRFAFGLVAGLLTVLLRSGASHAESVSAAILLVNALVPFIDRHTRPHPPRYASHVAAPEAGAPPATVATAETPVGADAA